MGGTWLTHFNVSTMFFVWMRYASHYTCEFSSYHAFISIAILIIVRFYFN